MNLDLQKNHPLFETHQLQSVSDYLMLLRGQTAYHFITPQCKGKVVMEIGCNTGFGTQLLAKEARRVYALDLNEPALAYAKKHHAADNIDYVLVDGKSFPVLSPMPDVAVFFQLIEHIQDDRGFLLQVRESISPKGKIAFSTPNAKLRLRKNEKPWNPFHVREYTLEQLKAFLDAFSPRYEIYGVFGTPPVARLEKKRLARPWLKKAFLEPYQKLTGHFSIKAKLKKIFVSGPTKEAPELDLQELSRTYPQGSYYVSKDNLTDALDFLAFIDLDHFV